MQRVTWTLAACLLGGCILPADVVRQRFSMDTSCAESAIQVSSLPGSAYRAQGCGWTATYVCPAQEGPISCMRESDPRALPAGDAGTGVR